MSVDSPKMLAVAKRLKLRRMGSRYMLVEACADSVNLTHVYTLNESAALLWQWAAEAPFDTARLTTRLAAHYGLEPEAISADVEAQLDEWLSMGLVTDD